MDFMEADRVGVCGRKRNRAVVRDKEGEEDVVGYLYAVGEEVRGLELGVESKGELTLNRKFMWSTDVNRKIYELGMSGNDVWARTLFQIFLFGEYGNIKRTVNFE